MAYTISQTTAARNHIVIKPGQYSEPKFATGGAAQTSAPQITIHGNTSRITGSATPMLDLRLPTTIKNLELVGLMDQKVIVTGGNLVRLQHVTTHKGAALEASGPVEATDFIAEQDALNSSQAILLHSGANLTLERAHITGGLDGVICEAGSNVKLTNVMIDGVHDTAISAAAQVGGTIDFMTAVSSGLGGFETVSCGPNLTIRSSILYNLTGNTIAPGSTCPIIGSSTTPGIQHGFVSQSGGNFHLSAQSPDLDKATLGPATDFEGDPRPQGSGFDLGADEFVAPK